MERDLRERRRPNWNVAMMGALAMVVCYAIVHALASPLQHGKAHDKQVPGAVPAPSAHRSTATATPGQNQQPVLVQLAATEGCWVGVYRPDGALRWQAYIRAGAARSWVFAHRVSMKIANPGGIVLTVNGHKMTCLGSQPITLNLRPGPDPDVSQSKARG
jgi:hypothetical protein